MVIAYILGSAFSGLAGYIGISIATIANVKAASAARKGLAPSFMAGFRGGAVMGMAVVVSHFSVHLYYTSLPTILTLF